MEKLSGLALKFFGIQGAEKPARKTAGPGNDMLDTLKISKDLEAAGVERKQAEAHTGAIASIVTDMPTKADIEVLRVEISKYSSVMWVMGIHAGLTLIILASILGFAFGLFPAARNNAPAPVVQFVPVPAPPAADPPAPLPVDAE